MRIRPTYFFILLLIFIAPSCFVVDHPFSALAPGPWRGVLKLEPSMITPNPKGRPLPEKLNIEFEEVTLGELPFNFEVVYENENDFYLLFRNGSERIRIDNIRYGRDRRTAKDTVLINFPVYDSYIKAIYEENILEGEWIVTNRPNYRIPFVARQGRNHRFTTLQKEPVTDLSGKWEVTFFGEETEDPYKAIGEFEQKGNELTGTFITETGDYRFLEGAVQADKLYLSCFDGSHAFLFEAKIQEADAMIGTFRSGSHYRTTWEAKRNPEFSLKDPYDLTHLKEGYERMEFAFENPSGQIITLNDSKFEDKLKIIQIFGTWCPNCRDESLFLLDYLKQRPNAPVEVVALAFERYREKEKAMAAIQRFKKQFEVPYEVLLGGFYEKSAANEALPMLNQIISYPTMIILDANNKIRKIHTGFAGPATSKYQDFKDDFDQLMKELSKELN